jgi:hypothetical protein
MAITYVWNIVELERYTDNGGVFIAHYTCRGTDDITGTAASSYGATNFRPDPDAEGFIPFDELTEEIVIGWVKGQNDPDSENLGVSVEEGIARKISALDNPTTEKGMPW